jgi:outer membrane protein OmpA-like peptidoglycan-associated protein
MPEILDTSTTTYVVEISNAERLKVKPIVEAGYGAEKWSLEINADEEPLVTLEGNGEPFIERNIDLWEIGLNKLRSRKTINARLTITDVRGQTFVTDKAETSIKYLRREERVAQKMGYRVVEKYALILFDFNSDTVKERNKVVLDRVIERINQFPSAKVTIVGHTDIIGKEEYNIDLSKRRAKTVYDQILKTDVVNPERISYDGFGPNEAPYENSLPEGRSFNRTVTILLEYEQKE